MQYCTFLINDNFKFNCKINSNCYCQSSEEWNNIMNIQMHGGMAKTKLIKRSDDFIYAQTNAARVRINVCNA